MNLKSSQRVTIVHVAQAAGVSVTTVSHALNGRGQVDRRTRERVEQVALQLGYRPNRHAQRLRTGEAHMIALVSSMPFAVAGGPSRLGFLMEIAAVAASAALSRGMALVLVPPAESGATPLDALDVDAALVVEPVAKDPTVEHFLRQGLPVVTIGRQAKTRAPIPYVDLRSADTAALMLEHLAAQRCRRVALLIGAEERNSYIEAERVYRQFVARHHMPTLIAHEHEAAGEDGGRVAMLKLLQQDASIDGVCVPVDAFAVGAVRALLESGRRLPQDAAIITRYDGLRARMCEPPLSAVNLHLEQIAQRAVELLLDHLQKRTGDRSRAGPDPVLVPRASTQRLSRDRD
jgi:DNA-binding LacI/PurR family transcriptional regulator